MAKRFRLVLGSLALVALVVLGGLLLRRFSRTERMLTIGFTGTWRTLNPWQQHTLVGELVLSNQFDPLVGFSRTGDIVPSAASAWRLSEDAKRLEFTIDTSLRFSDGTNLTASDFKKGWEDALRSESLSANHSQQDLLYRVVGFDRFERTGSIEGLRAESPDKFVIEFSEPFRMALDHLAGVRFSAYRKQNDHVVGTGRYVISAQADGSLLLQPNPYHPNKALLDPLRVVSLTPDIIPGKLRSGEVDAVAYGFGDEFGAGLLEDDDFEVSQGQDSLHVVLEVNGISSPVFQHRENRLALQYLMYQGHEERPLAFEKQGLARSDFQVLLPLQPGRLPDKEVRELIEKGRPFVDGLRTAAKEHPLTMLGSPGCEWVLELLRKNGITFSARAGAIPRSEMVPYYYKRDDYDFLYAGFSVANGDPDGIYHALGRNGAILNPVMLRAPVADLLEGGRSLVDRTLLPAHYAKLTRAVLEEVPIVHLGFRRSMALSRKHRINTQAVAVRRNEGHLHVFVPRRGLLPW